MDSIDNIPGVLVDARVSAVVRAAKRARDCAAALSHGVGPAVAPELVSGELANRVLPHLEADVRLAGEIAEPERGRLITELNEQRRELGRLVEELDRLLFDVAARPRASAPRRRAARNLDQVAGLLDRHLAGDRELQLSFQAAPDGDRRWAGLVGEAEAGERVAARSLRFVWHPPVAPTEAKALRKNPNATRVVILDAEDASAARSAGNDGHERRIER